MGLLALLVLHDARRAARTSRSRELVLLDEQDRSLWDRRRIAEGIALVEQAIRTRRLGPYVLQAAIAAVHAEAASAGDTDWAQIVGLYDVLMRADSSPVVELNRAVAVAMRDGPAAGLELIDAILARGDLAGYHHAPRGPRGPVPPAGTSGRGRGRVPGRAGADPAGHRTPVPRAQAA
jgi:RNA polymerase sigma-70 factor (ECF subfamily)